MILTKILYFDITILIMQLTRLLFLAFILVIYSCGKKPYLNPCEGLKQPVAEFAFKEMLTDTAFYADTIFRDNYVDFVALKNYKSVLWKIGSDPRDFTSADFNLSFINDLGTINIVFTGKNEPNTQCFPADNGTYQGSRPLTIVEQFEKPTLTISPLVGRYKGAFTNTPNDTFTVRIDYFDSTKYDVTMTGNKNFYWISNIPKGFIDSTSSISYEYPELRNGMSVEMGYKSLRFGDITDIQRGRGFGNLIKDTLTIYYNHPQTGRKLFIGKKI